MSGQLWWLSCMWVVKEFIGINPIHLQRLLRFWSYQGLSWIDIHCSGSLLLCWIVFCCCSQYYYFPLISGQDVFVSFAFIFCYLLIANLRNFLSSSLCFALYIVCRFSCQALHVIHYRTKHCSGAAPGFLSISSGVVLGHISRHSRSHQRASSSFQFCLYSSVNESFL